MHGLEFEHWAPGRSMHLVYSSADGEDARDWHLCRGLRRCRRTEGASDATPAIHIHGFDSETPDIANAWTSAESAATLEGIYM